MAPAKKKVQILIVDDDVAVRKTMNEYINTAGYESYAVSCAEEALEQKKKKIISCCYHRYHPARHGWPGFD